MSKLPIVERLKDFCNCDEKDIAEAASLIAELVAALEPFEQAVDEAEKRMKEHGVSENASSGLGIKFKHLFAARAALARARSKGE